jgi:hypothetical protein
MTDHPDIYLQLRFTCRAQFYIKQPQDNGNNVGITTSFCLKFGALMPRKYQYEHQQEQQQQQNKTTKHKAYPLW